MMILASSMGGIFSFCLQISAGVTRASVGARAK